MPGPKQQPRRHARAEASTQGWVCGAHGCKQGTRRSERSTLLLLLLPRPLLPPQAGYNLFFAETFPFIVMAANASLCTSLAVLTAVMRPCCIGAVNIARGTGFTLAAYSQVCAPPWSGGWGGTHWGRGGRPGPAWASR